MRLTDHTILGLVIVAILALTIPVRAQSEDEYWDPTGGAQEEEREGSNQSAGQVWAGFSAWVRDEVWGSLVMSGRVSWERVFPPSRLSKEYLVETEYPEGKDNLYPYADPDLDDLPPRALGAPVLPFFRVDVAYQEVNSDLSALDTRVEVGAGTFYVEARTTRYKYSSLDYTYSNPYNNGSDGSFEINQWYAGIRLTLSERLMIGMAGGQMVLEDQFHDRGNSISTPVFYYPTEWFGLEFRPAWAHVRGSLIEDYDLGCVIATRGVSLRFGYRKINTNPLIGTLDGPYVGLSFHF